jgi:hypothetical protein
MSLFPGQYCLPCFSTFTKESTLDNVPRANRVQQLAADIARFQTQIKEEIEDGRVQDDKAIIALGEIAKKAGYQTLEEYETAAFKLLTPEERANIDKMKKEVTALDEDMGISHMVFRGLIAVGVLLSGASKYDPVTETV